MRRLRSFEFHADYWLSKEVDYGWQDILLNVLALTLEIVVDAQIPTLEQIKLDVKGVTNGSNLLTRKRADSSEPLRAWAAIQHSLLRMPMLKKFVIDNGYAGKQVGWLADPKLTTALPPGLRTSYRQVLPTLHANGKLQILPTKDEELPRPSAQ